MEENEQFDKTLFDTQMIHLYNGGTIENSNC